MGRFLGGSAYAMSREISEGYILISPNSLKKYSNLEIRELQRELEKIQREARAEQPPLDDLNAIKKKNRKIQRISSALLTIRNFLRLRK
jgi:hypothetical protein